jgi:hypothetical protein
MNWLGFVVAIIASLAIVTALVFLYFHRHNRDDHDEKTITHQRGNDQLNINGKRVYGPYTAEQLKALRDPVTGHLMSRSKMMRLYVEARRKLTGYDSRKVEE